MLTKLGEAGDSLPKAFQVFLTYPFVDEVVGRNPAQARNLHMGDYTNLSIQMDIDLSKGLPELPGLPLPEGPVKETLDQVTRCVTQLTDDKPGAPACRDLPAGGKELVCKQIPDNPFCRVSLPGGGDEGGGGALPELPSLPGLGRALPGAVFFGTPTTVASGGATSEELGYDPTLAALLIQGTVQR